MCFLYIVAAALLIAICHFNGRKHGSLPAPLDEWYALGGLRRKTTYRRIGAVEAEEAYYIVVKAIDSPAEGEVRTVTNRRDVPDIFHLGPYDHVIEGWVPR